MNVRGRRPPLLLATLLACAPLAACGGAPVARAVMPNQGHDPSELAKCKVSADHEAPLVTEWPASSKARLETLLKDGAVAVAYSGCEMRIVDSCRPKGTYAWSRTTLATDATTIRNEDDLYAKLPLGAAALAGELKASGNLEVRTTVSGQMKLVGGGADVPPDDTCKNATHVVTALSVGAFKLVAGGSANASGSVGLGNLGAGGSAAESEEVVRSAGEPSHCEEATDEAPNGSCSSPIQVFLQPVQRLAPAVTYEPGDGGPAKATTYQAPAVMWHDVPSLPQHHATSKVPGFVLAGLGVISAGVGSYLLVHAGSEKSDIQKGGFATGGDIGSAASGAATSNLVGLLMVASGLSFGLVSLPWLFGGSGGGATTTSVTTGSLR